jgi:hypothetical protein
MRRRWRAAALGVACSIALGIGAQAQAARSHLRLDFYSATVSAAQYSDLLAKGYDVAAAHEVAGGTRVDLVLSPGQAATLRGKGVRPTLKKNRFGRTARQEAAHQASGGYIVWRDYDSPDGIAAQLRQIADDNKDIAELHTIGTTGQGRPIYALQLTKHPKDKVKRPAVLFSATQHAREWIAPETDMRILKWYLARYAAHDKDVKKLLEKTELWFVPVMNPDGYQYTFQSPDTRLWRKNLRDNNGNGTTEVGDGVDPNRNYPEHWNYDGEGSSGVPTSDTYRGPSAGSEPETTAMTGLLARVHFAFQVNFHSFGPPSTSRATTRSRRVCRSPTSSSPCPTATRKPYGSWRSGSSARSS